MDTKKLQNLINSFLIAYNNVPTTRREYRKWIVTVIEIGEKIFRQLKSKEYTDLCDSINVYKRKFKPGNIRKHLFKNGFCEDV